jgi:RimJ/RimL family protein N-acetyltransferase
MNFNELIQKSFELDQARLTPVKTSDRSFFRQLFQIADIKKNVLVPDELQRDYGLIVDAWGQENCHEVGGAWVINSKRKGIFGGYKPVGFVSFQFRKNPHIARLTYALHPSQRGIGLATKSVARLIEELAKRDVYQFEAAIERGHNASENVVQSLGFENTNTLIIDRELKAKGIATHQILWEKTLLLKPIPNIGIGNYPENTEYSELATDANYIVSLMEAFGQSYELLIRYFYLAGRSEYKGNNYPQAYSHFKEALRVFNDFGRSPLHEYYYWIGLSEKKMGKGHHELAHWHKLALDHYMESDLLISKEELHKMVID